MYVTLSPSSPHPPHDPNVFICVYGLFGGVLVGASAAATAAQRLVLGTSFVPVLAQCRRTYASWPGQEPCILALAPIKIGFGLGQWYLFYITPREIKKYV